MVPPTHTIGSQTHNNTASHAITQPVHTTTTDDPTLDTHITKTQNVSYILLAGLNYRTEGSYILWMHNKAKKSHSQIIHHHHHLKKHCQIGS